MSALFSFGIKQPNGSYKNYTGSVQDKTDQYGNNLAIYEEQTKAQREAKAPKKYIANGKVFWTDGSIQVAEKKTTVINNDRSVSDAIIVDDLPF